MSVNNEPGAPPPMEFFDSPRPPLGGRSMSIALGDARLLLTGLDAGLEERLDERFAPFRADHPDARFILRVEFLREERDYFIEPGPGPGSNPVFLECDGPRVRYVGHRVAGWFDVGPGRGRLLLARGPFERAERAVENYIRAAVAWLAASVGGALVHSAGVVFRGRGYLFYGESGAGKSTLAACNRRGRVVGDDLCLVLPDATGRPALVASPFVSTLEQVRVESGSFPLAAGFRLVQARRAEVRPVPRPRALAELVGNLPFVAEAFAKRPDLFERLQGAFGDVPLAHLHFRMDDSFWDAIEAAGLVR